MEKYKVFVLYQQNKQGGHQPALTIKPEPYAVYLAADVELLLAQIRNSCVDDGDEANALFMLSPGEIRALIDKSLMESATK